MVSKARKAVLEQRMVYFEATDFYKVVKKQCIRYGYTPLKSAIFGLLALEECMNDAQTPDRLPYLSTIGVVALPEIERLEPADEEEAQEKRDMLEAYARHDRKSLPPLLDQWHRVREMMRKEET